MSTDRIRSYLIFLFLVGREPGEFIIFLALFHALVPETLVVFDRGLAGANSPQSLGFLFSFMELIGSTYHHVVVLIGIRWIASFCRCSRALMAPIGVSFRAEVYRPTFHTFGLRKPADGYAEHKKIVQHCVRRQEAFSLKGVIAFLANPPVSLVFCSPWPIFGFPILSAIGHGFVRRMAERRV